jgi:hypothetical protein
MEGDVVPICCIVILSTNSTNIQENNIQKLPESNEIRIFTARRQFIQQISLRKAKKYTYNVTAIGERQNINKSGWEGRKQKELIERKLNINLIQCFLPMPDVPLAEVLLDAQCIDTRFLDSISGMY